MEWKVARAKQNLSKVIQAAAEEPQKIFNRDRLVAVVVDGPTFEKLERSRRSVGDEFADFRALCAEEDYELPESPRVDRPNAFVEILDDETV